MKKKKSTQSQHKKMNKHMKQIQRAFNIKMTKRLDKVHTRRKRAEQREVRRRHRRRTEDAVRRRRESRRRIPSGYAANIENSDEEAWSRRHRRRVARAVRDRHRARQHNISSGNEANNENSEYDPVKLPESNNYNKNIRYRNVNTF